MAASLQGCRGWEPLRTRLAADSLRRRDRQGGNQAAVCAGVPRGRQAGAQQRARRTPFRGRLRTQQPSVQAEDRLGICLLVHSLQGQPASLGTTASLPGSGASGRSGHFDPHLERLVGRPRAGHSKQAERGWDGQDERPEAAAPPLTTERTPRRGSPPAGSSGPLPPQVPQQPSPGGDCGQVQAAPAGLGGPGLRIASRLQAVPRPRGRAGGRPHLEEPAPAHGRLRHRVHTSHTHLNINVQTRSCSTPFRNKVFSAAHGRVVCRDPRGHRAPFTEPLCTNTSPLAGRGPPRWTEGLRGWGWGSGRGTGHDSTCSPSPQGR